MWGLGDAEPGIVAVVVVLGMVGGTAFVVGTLVNLAHRVRAGRPLFAPGATDAVFDESWSSGGARWTALGRLGRASNWLRITLTPQELTVEPQVLFVLGGSSWTHRISRASIVAISLERRGLTRWVKVEFTTSRGDVRAIGLLPRDPEAFVRAFESRPSAS